MRAAERGVPASAFFLDTNVLVYSFSEQDAAKREVARALAEADGARVSTQVLSELAHVLTRRFGVPAREVKDRITNIATACEIVPVTPAIVLDALRIMERFGYGFFDSQIIAAALASGASVLYSEDLQADQIIDETLAIRSPFRLRAEQRAKLYQAGKHGARRLSPYELAEKMKLVGAQRAALGAGRVNTAAKRKPATVLARGKKGRRRAGPTPKTAPRPTDNKA